MSLSCVPLKYSFPSDKSLTITLGNEYQELVEASGYNVTCDLTLHKGLYIGNKRGKRVLDLRLNKQRRFLRDTVYKIIERYNIVHAVDTDTIEKAISVYEVQTRTGAVHCHTNFKINIGSNPSFALVKLKDIVKSLGFHSAGVFIEFIKDPLARRLYLLKSDTKYPDYVSYYYYPSDSPQGGSPMSLWSLRGSPDNEGETTPFTGAQAEPASVTLHLI